MQRREYDLTSLGEGFAPPPGSTKDQSGYTDSHNTKHWVHVSPESTNARLLSIFLEREAAPSAVAIVPERRTKMAKKKEAPVVGKTGSGPKRRQEARAVIMTIGAMKLNGRWSGRIRWRRVPKVATSTNSEPSSPEGEDNK